jgi:hypothetical protein
VWLNYDRFAGDDRNGGGDDRGSFRFHGRNFFVSAPIMNGETLPVPWGVTLPNMGGANTP